MIEYLSTRKPKLRHQFVKHCIPVSSWTHWLGKRKSMVVLSALIAATSPSFSACWSDLV
jgi:hypothetical protein